MCNWNFTLYFTVSVNVYHGNWKFKFFHCCVGNTMLNFEYERERV